MEEKLDQILEHLHEVKLEQALAGQRLDTYNKSLEKHMKRSDMLEKQVNELYRLKYYAMGAMAVVTGLLTIFFDVIKTYIFGGPK